MESNSIEEILGGTSTPAASQLSTAADADRIGVYDASETAGSRFKWITLANIKSYITNALGTVYTRLDWSTQADYLPMPEKSTVSASISGDVNIDLSLGRVIPLVVSSNVTSFNFSNAKRGVYLFRFTIGGSGGYTLTLAGTKWSSVSPAPTLTTAAGRIDTWFCLYNGTTMDIIAVNKEVQTS